MAVAFAPTRPDAIAESLWNACLTADPCAVSDVLHKHGLHAQTMRAEIQGLSLSTRIAGTVRTMASRPLAGEPDPQREYGLLFDAIDGLAAGEVLVTDEMGCCVWGELCCERALNRRANGTIVDGYYRDAVRVIASGLPVFSRGRHMSDLLYHREITAIDEAVVCGGVACHPGDLVLGGADGVVVVPQALVGVVILEAVAKSDTEDKVREALRGGVSASEAYERFGVL